MTSGLQLIAAVAGAGLAVLTGASVVGTLLIQRGRVGILMRAVDRLVAACFRPVSARVRDYGRRDALLAAHAPTVLLAQLAAWIICFGVAFSLLLQPATDHPLEASREAVSSMLTLGFTSTHGAWATFVDGAAALTGLVVIALQIAYLPTLYAAYNRRETEVTLLEVRAGEPAWGPELLARTHYGILGVDLGAYYSAWERWAADIAESHASYPVLLRFRSPRPLASWVVALLAVLDAAAIHSAVAPAAAPVQARLCLRMGFVCLRKLALSARIPVQVDPRPDGPIRLTESEFREGYQRLVAVGFPVERSPEEAWPHFRGWRVNYEESAYALAYLVDAVPARWSGPRRSGEEPISTVRPPNRTPDDPDSKSPLVADR